MFQTQQYVLLLLCELFPFIFFFYILCQKAKVIEAQKEKIGAK